MAASGRHIGDAENGIGAMRKMAAHLGGDRDFGIKEYEDTERNYG